MDKSIVNRNRRRAILSTAFGALAAMLPSLARAQSARPRQKIVISSPFGPGSPGGVPLWIGGPLGFFDEEGLDVEIATLAGRPAETVGLVAAGKADLAISQPDALVVPLARGSDQGLVWVFTPYQRPVFVIAVGEGHPIASARQLEGKNVGMTALGPPFATFMALNVRADGGDPAKVKTVAIGGSAAMEALRRGDIDAFVSNRSELAAWSQAVGTPVKTLPLPPEVERGFAAGFLMRRDAIAAQRDACGRYLRAYLKSAFFAQENPEAAIRVNWQLYPAVRSAGGKPEPQALAEAMAVLAATVSEFKPSPEGRWGYISDDRWRAFVASLGLSQAIPDVAKLRDNSLLDTAAAFDAAKVREQARSYRVRP